MSWGAQIYPENYGIYRRFKDIFAANAFRAAAGIATGTAVGYIDRLGLGDYTNVVQGVGTASGLATISGSMNRNQPATALVKAAGMMTWEGIPFQVGKQISRKTRNLRDTSARSEGFVKEPGFDKDTHRAARTAMEAYKPVDERKSHGNWEYLKHYSNDRIAVYEDHHNKHWHVAMRGTDDLWDLGQDASIATGAYKNDPGFYDNIKKKMKALQNLHAVHHPRDGKFTVTGHSLAGTGANILASDPEIAKGIDRSDAFNPGHGYGGMGKHDKSHHIHINNHDFAAFMVDSNTGASVHYHEEVTDTYNPITHIARSHWNEDWERQAYWREEWDYGGNTYRSDALVASEEPIVETGGDDP